MSDLGGLHLPNGSPIDIGPALAQQQAQQQLAQWGNSMMGIYGLTPQGRVHLRTCVGHEYLGTGVSFLVTAGPAGPRVEAVAFHETAADRSRAVPWHAVAEIGPAT